jgi:hypothetical protein
MKLDNVYTFCLVAIVFHEANLLPWIMKLSSNIFLRCKVLIHLLPWIRKLTLLQLLLPLRPFVILDYPFFLHKFSALKVSMHISH